MPRPCSSRLMPWHRLCAGATAGGQGAAQLRRPEPMLDLLFLAVTIGFFAATVAYVHACDRL